MTVYNRDSFYYAQVSHDVFVAATALWDTATRNTNYTADDRKQLRRISQKLAEVAKDLEQAGDIIAKGDYGELD